MKKTKDAELDVFLLAQRVQILFFWATKDIWVYARGESLEAQAGNVYTASSN